MSEIAFDLETNGCEAAAQPSDPHHTTPKHLDQRFLTAPSVSPRPHRRASADFLETAHFLRACSLCKRRLIPGRDIYMYRGDSAFCSLECRQQQMNQDERKEKCSFLATKKKAATTAAPPDVSTKKETVATV